LLTQKDNYFFAAESTLDFTLSFAAVAVESIFALAESAIALTVSFAAAAVESTLASVLEEPLHAANAPIAKNRKSFFIVICLFVNDLVLILRFQKSNLSLDQKS
jgi:hypothetical protein